MLIALALSTLLQAAPAQERTTILTLWVQQVPVGSLVLSETPKAFLYRSTLMRGAKAKSFSRKLLLGPGQTLPETLWLLKQPVEQGCVTVLEERSNEPESVCITRLLDDGVVEGTIAQQRFTARYIDGALSTLTIGEARFERARGDQRLSTSDPFQRGFPVSGGGASVRIDPRSDDVEVQRVKGLGVLAKESENCLDVAERIVRETKARAVVKGVVIEKDRAFPHAWVELSDGRYGDPTVDSRSPEETRVYVAFLRTPGRLYLDLLAGSRRLIRTRAP